ncbi:hypothetical protein GCM10009848_53110 [Micromonospora lupini]
MSASTALGSSTTGPTVVASGVTRGRFAPISRAPLDTQPPGRLRPHDVGLEPGGLRKVTELRREELALLAGQQRRRGPAAAPGLVARDPLSADRQAPLRDGLNRSPPHPQRDFMIGCTLMRLTGPHAP